ncbi:hypothetical protein BGZ58_005504 [Dissophora ornata]|nr:hypothetical protein BGZ58_005504 [Dissophora ornata]
MFEHEMLFTPAIQRPMYAARNDDVHLRLRVKLTVFDQTRKQQYDTQGDNERRKKLKSGSGTQQQGTNTDGQNNSIPIDGQTNGDTEMVSSTQEVDNKGGQPSTQSAAATATISNASLQGSSTLSNGDQQLHSTASSAEHKHRDGSKTVVTKQHQLCQYGHPEPGRTIVVRSAILVKIHGDAFGFLSLLGYGFEEEFVRRGYNFMYNNICRISVFRKYKLSKQHEPFSAIVPEGEAAGGQAAETVSPWLVEITSSFVSQENVNSMSEEISVVRNLLAGSVAF